MEATRHVLLVGEGAMRFAAQQGIPAVSPDDLVTPAAWAEYERYREEYGAA